MKRKFGRESFTTRGAGNFCIKDQELRSIYRRERMTPSTGIWNPKLTTVEQLFDEEQKVIPIDELQEQIPAHSDFEELLFLGDLREKIDELLESMTEREGIVLTLRFGLDNCSPRTLAEVADVLRVGRERIREIEARALKKMRHPTRSCKLKPFLYDSKPWTIHRCTSLLASVADETTTN